MHMSSGKAKGNKLPEMRPIERGMMSRSQAEMVTCPAGETDEADTDPEPPTSRYASFK